MKIRIIYFIFILLLFKALMVKGQVVNTFSKIYKILAYDQQEYQNILTTDSCYWITGWGIDTTFPYLWKAFISKISLSGEILNINELGHPNKKFGWPNNICFFDNTIYSAYLDPYDSIRIVGYDVFRDSIYESFSWGTITSYAKEVYGPSLAIDIEGSKFIVATNNDVDTLMPYISEIQLIKLTKDNQPEFVKRYTSRNFYYDVNDILINDSGEILVFGSRYKYFYQFNDNSYNNGFILILEQSGDIKKWIICQDFTSGNYDILPIEDGNYICATSQLNHKTDGNVTGIPSILRIDSTGKSLWSISPDQGVPSLGWLAYQNMQKIIKMDGANFAALGSFEFLDSIDPILVGHDSRVVMLNFDLAGNINWQRIYKIADGLETSYAFDFKKDSDSGYIISGSSNVFQSNIRDACILIKTDQFGCVIPGCDVVKNADYDNNKNEINIYPNPAGEYIVLLNSIAGKTHYQILTSNGIILSEFYSYSQNEQIIVPLHKYRQGKYIVTVKYPNGSQKSKVFFKE